MLTIGTSTPAIAPTRGANPPAALTTCSATTVPCSVTTSQLPPGRRAMSTTRLRSEISAPPRRATAAMAIVLLAGSVWPSPGV